MFEPMPNLAHARDIMMSAIPLPAPSPVRVAVGFRDAAVAGAWTDELSLLGLIVVPLSEGAEVILTDAEARSGLPAVVLGGTDPSAAGQLPSDASPAQVAAALSAVAAGLIVRAPADEAFRPLTEAPLGELLTPREVEVLQALGEGLSNKQVARRLDISLHTVKFYVEAVFRKLDAHSRAEAVAKGLRRRLIETVEL